MALSELTFQFDGAELPDPIARWIEVSQARLMTYWDQFAQRPLPQYIECDFEYVAAALSQVVEKQLIDGKLFVEWGCGFGVVTGVASLLGLDAVGIEAEDFLCGQARELLKKGGHYHDLYRRERGGWRIARSRIVRLEPVRGPA